MEWFHCNNCFLRKGREFFVSSCGHVLCESCISPSRCSVCQATCNYLHISDQVSPTGKLTLHIGLKSGVRCKQSDQERVWCEMVQMFFTVLVVMGTRGHHVQYQMKPQDQIFFRDPATLIQTRLDHIAQIAMFQTKQKDRVIAFHKHRLAEMEQRLKETSERCHRC
ncbi:hypothetical protein NFI96_027651, partial [Prochilodus magdalenae]